MKNTNKNGLRTLDGGQAVDTTNQNSISSNYTPTQLELREKFYYTNGNLYFLTGGRKHNKAGYLSKSLGYWVIGFNGGKYLAHRLIWIYHNGNIKDNYVVDHINNFKIDNRIENLRQITRSQNQFNRKNTKGFKAVGNRFYSIISV